VVEDDEDAQLDSLKAGLLVARTLALVALAFTTGLRSRRPGTVTPETVTPETVTPETVTPETVTPETATTEAPP
jgi:hypothetical protein